MPITQTDLQKLYWIINFNLRDLLAHADDYCMYIFESRRFPAEDLEKQAKFDAWLRKQTQDQYQELSARLSRDAWELLDTAMSEDLKGTFGPGDFTYFKRNSFQAISYKTLATHMKKFEDLGVVARSVHDTEGDEKRRTIYTVTSKGALVHYARFARNETRTLASLWLRRSSGLSG